MNQEQGTNCWPRWIEDVVRLLPIRSQFLIAGNIRDVFLTPTDIGEVLMPAIACLWSRLSLEGYELFIIYDVVDGIRVFPDEKGKVARASELLNLKQSGGKTPPRIDGLIEILQSVVSLKQARVAAIIDFASRISASPHQLDPSEQKFFTALEKMCLSSTPVAPMPTSPPLHNPVIWLFNRAQDAPSWFVLDSQRSSSLTIPNPDYESRLKAAKVLCPLFADSQSQTDAQKSLFISSMADSTDGMTLQNLADIAQLAHRLKLPVKDVEDAVTAFKVGIIDNPWKKDYLRDKIRNALAMIEHRVKGQRQAAVKTIDILTRSVMGLTGAQAKKSTGRPRGVLFFAGPTGVGKTELAKTLTQLVFGDERAYIRFDMSEFSEEHSGARLLGAPPGYIGYDAGGELTNAIKQRPFSVVLFDEIEKCHPRLLDKFLQILEDGRLTDGRGNTVYFSEAILIFTSNLGVFIENEDGQRTQHVLPTDPYEQVEKKIREAIADYFTYRLGRPELLNRIGDNIVVFNFISPDIAIKILEGMLNNVAARVLEEHNVRLEFSQEALRTIQRYCTEDLSYGGRGIGNKLESSFINPLARAIFSSPPQGTVLRVQEILEQDRVYSVKLQCE